MKVLLLMFLVLIPLIFHSFIFTRFVAIFRRLNYFSVSLVSFLCTIFVFYINPSKMSAMIGNFGPFRRYFTHLQLSAINDTGKNPVR